MSKQTIEFVIGKIILDAAFRDALLASPDQTLAQFDLTRQEQTRLKSIDSETMEHLAKILHACPAWADAPSESI
jgi:hypothetical protein